MIATYIEPPHASAARDAAVAGVVEYRLAQKGAPLPRWIRKFGLPVADRWSPHDYPYTVEDEDVPEPLVRRNIIIEAREFESA